MSKLPRSVGIPPLNDPSFDSALVVGASAPLTLVPSTEGEGKINPLAGMGLSDDQYAALLQNLVDTESFSHVEGGNARFMIGEKRGLDDVSDSREPKRSRFETIE
jgi:osomolarity two-component system, response regulator SKN7